MIADIKTITQEVFDTFPAKVMWHLTILWSGKVALAEADKAHDDAVWGANDAAMAVLSQFELEPTELVVLHRRDDERPFDGIRLKDILFQPIDGITLTPWQEKIYQASLYTAEIQMRRLYDTIHMHSDIFTN